EEGIASAAGDGFDLRGDFLDGALLQAKQLMLAAQSALEEGSLGMVKTHMKAFELKIDATYQSIEESVLGQKQAAAAKALAQREIMIAAEMAPAVQAEKLAVEELTADEELQAVEEPPAVEELNQQTASVLGIEIVDETPMPDADDMISATERDALLNRQPDRAKEAPTGKTAYSVQEEDVDEEEYELVIPKLQPQEAAAEADEEPELLLFETEDDALDELERISGALTRIRQQIKRSYL
ncbi:hypothetical protein MXD63_36795, partial [Frankia sp. Cpl3]|nr:hypothetical protein [Frankia sp. Cpl3]